MADQILKGACYFFEKQQNVYSWFCIRNADDSYHQEGLIYLGDKRQILLKILGNNLDNIKVQKMDSSYPIKEFTSRHLIYMKAILIKTLKENLKIINKSML